jgi:hypothetical protein
MNHNHEYIISVLLIQLAFQIIAFILWIHLSGLDGLRRERMIELLEQPIHIAQDEGSDEGVDLGEKKDQ